MKHMRAKIAALLLAAMCLSSAACAEVFFEKMPQAWEGKPLLRWTIFNVNQADAMLLECGEESMLVDGGPDRYGERLRDVLDARGLRSSMKYVLNTHFHDDHIGGSPVCSGMALCRASSCSRTVISPSAATSG